MQATFKKLRSGRWGIAGRGDPPEPGATVAVAKRSGDETDVMVGRVLWSGDGKWIATVDRSDRAPSSERTAYERTAYERGDRSAGARAAHYDRSGVYASDGTLIGRVSCGCIDYPCCGH